MLQDFNSEEKDKQRAQLVFPTVNSQKKSGRRHRIMRRLSGFISAPYTRHQAELGTWRGPAQFACYSRLSNRVQEIGMKNRLLLATVIAIAFTGTAMADEYYVMSNPTTHRCTVTTTKPADREYVTQIGPLAFRTREEAESRMRTVKTCEGGSVGSGSDTTIIKDKD